MSITQLTAKELQQKMQDQSQFTLLDVREQHEYEYASIPGSQHIPMNQIPQRLSEIDSDNDCVVICHHGMRSQQVAVFLEHSGFSNIFNLSGGIDAWSLECDNTVSRY